MSRKMKDSGIEWLGNIPEDWNISKFKNMYTYKKEIVGERVNEFERLALTLNGVIKRDKEDNEGLQPKQFNNYQIINKNDFIFKMIDLENISTSRVGLSYYNGIVSPAYIRFSPNDKKQQHKYFYYYLMSMYYNCVFNNIGGNGVRSSLTYTDIGNFLCPLPCEKIQKLIVETLDKKCSQIDTLILNQQKQIEKLKQYKQSLITEVVTKGLEPNVPMKDSGVEWIGEIAENNNIYRLKFLLNGNMQYGANESGSKDIRTEIRYIRITDINEDGTLKNNEDNLYLTKEQALSYILKEKDILFARSGATVGKTFIYFEKYGKSAFAGYLIKAECNKNKLLPEYLLYYTQSNIYEKWKNMIFIQSTIQNIGASKYSNMLIIVPSIYEQEKIVNYLDKKCSQIDNLIKIKEEKIQKLNDYKKSIIYEYVTGKKGI